MLRAMQSFSKPLIYLASASPRRSALLTQVGIPHTVQPVDIDESIHHREQPEAYVRRLASEKAEALWDRLDDSARLPVLAADTSVAVDEHILGKPQDEDDEVGMLARLSGRTHRVYTAIALRNSENCRTQVSLSEVTFRVLSESEMRTYWRTGEPVDKAGGYAVQGYAALFIERISGSFSGIMGLPLFETGELLKSIGWSLDCSIGSRLEGAK
jgi:septum formation protein